MVTHGLSEEQVKDVLARAEEIQSGGATGAYDAVLSAAEEAGLSRDAVTQAIQERLGIYTSAPEVGKLVFAKGEKDRYFAAEVTGHGEGLVYVRFLNGSEHKLPVSSCRPLTLLPGEAVVCPWPNWGWWTCSVVRYDAATRKVHAADSCGTIKAFDLAQVYVKPTQPGSSKLPWLLVTAAAAGGAALGSLVTWLFLK